MKKIIENLTSAGRMKITLLLLCMSLFCFALSIIRLCISSRLTFLFLNWNLFLAFIPWALSTFIALNGYKTNKIILFALFSTWLLFFPNSPYILTDLFHLRLQTTMPAWFDLVLILSFAWTGLAFGFISLLDLEVLLGKYFKQKVIFSIIFLMLFAGSFGVYIGRFLRWNSWDIISDPASLFADIWDRFINPFSHPRTWGVTILMGILLNMMYWTFKFFKPQKV